MRSRQRRTDANLTEPIREAVFLQALEDGGTFSADYARLYGTPNALARFVSGEFAEPNTGGQIVSGLLRAYADEWLETGMAPDGVECPFERKLTATRQALAAVKRYEYANLAVRIDWDHGLERHFRSIAERLAPRAVAKAVQPVAITTVNTGYPVLDRFFKERQRRQFTGAAEPGNPDLPRNVSKAAHLRAAMIFHAFMQAPWRYKLGKCKRCLRYFVLQNNPPAVYKRGMYCSACKSIVSANVSNNTRRAAREQRLLDLAARMWFDWRPGPEFGDRSVWVADQVNRLLGEGEKKIARNWVTRNGREVEKRAKQQRNGRRAE